MWGCREDGRKPGQGRRDLRSLGYLPSLGPHFPGSFRNSFPNRTVFTQILASPGPPERRTRGLGEHARRVQRPGKAQARPGPAPGEYTLCALRAFALQPPSPGDAKAPFLGTAPPGAQGYLQPHAGCGAGTRSPAAGSGGKYSHGELRAVSGTTAPIPAEGPTPPSRAANFAVCLSSRAIPRRHLESDYAGDRTYQCLRIFLSVHLERLALEFTASRMQQCLTPRRPSIKFPPKEMSRGRESEKD